MKCLTARFHGMQTENIIVNKLKNYVHYKPKM